MKGFKTLSPKWNGIFPVAALCVTLGLLIGCGGQLGRIESAAVDTAVAEAEAAIEAAAAVDAGSLAPELFAAAEESLAAASAALAEKNGNDALRLAYRARAEAFQARTAALTIARNSELNAAILQKAAEAESMREAAAEKTEALKDLESELKGVRKTAAASKDTIRDLEKKNRELSDTRALYGEEVSRLSESLGEIQERAQRAETDIRKYGREVAELRRKLEVAQQMAKEEGHQKRAVIAEIDSLKKQLREQAQIYTERLAAAKQQNTGAKHEAYLEEKAAEARAYVASQAPLQPVKTGRVLLSTAQITAGKAALANWDRAWQAKNLNGHLAYYAPDIVANRVVVRESKENRSKVDLQQLEAHLQELGAHTWTRVKADVEVEGESVIGVYRSTRLAVPAENEDATALYNIWIREVWMHPVGNSWKIHHEIWQIYENVPNF